MPLNFCANLSFMFQNETSNLLERYALAKESGFYGVEVAFPYDIDIEKIVEVKEKHNLKQILLNAFPGELDHLSQGIKCLLWKIRDLFKRFSVI